MRIKYTRYHQARLEEYENVNFGGSIDVDLSKDSGDEEYAGVTVKEARNMLDEDMDTLLAISVKRAVASDHLETTHLYEYYEID